MDAQTDFPDGEESEEGAEIDGDSAGGEEQGVSGGEGCGALGGAGRFGGGVEEPAEPFAFLHGELVLADLGENGEGFGPAVIGGEGGGDDCLLGDVETFGIDGRGAVFQFEEGFSGLAGVEEGVDVGDAWSGVAGVFGAGGEVIEVDIEAEEEAEVVARTGDAFIASEGRSGGGDFVESADDDGIAAELDDGGERLDEVGGGVRVAEGLGEFFFEERVCADDGEDGERVGESVAGGACFLAGFAHHLQAFCGFAGLGEGIAAEEFPGMGWEGWGGCGGGGEDGVEVFGLGMIDEPCLHGGAVLFGFVEGDESGGEVVFADAGEPAHGGVAVCERCGAEATGGIFGDGGLVARVEQGVETIDAEEHGGGGGWVGAQHGEPAFDFCWGDDAADGTCGEGLCADGGLVTAEFAEEGDEFLGVGGVGGLREEKVGELGLAFDCGVEGYGGAQFSFSGLGVVCGEQFLSLGEEGVDFGRVWRSWGGPCGWGLDDDGVGIGRGRGLDDDLW